MLKWRPSYKIHLMLHDVQRFLLPTSMASKETRRGVEEEDLANVEFETSEDVEVIPTVDSMALREDLLR